MIIVSYNMAREIPRTIYSLSPAMQAGTGPDDYEVIVVDNGSNRPFDESLCRKMIPGLRVFRTDSPTVSPVPALNLGLEKARADLIGVMIDGARLASPGLLGTALEASRLHPRPVIGTLAFHLGPDVQMKSIANGYDQQAEDRLLAESEWEQNGYRLFEISVFAGSSSGGWFRVPAETNALFLTRGQWKDLGGYDPGFVTPGGGLANLDVWARACADPEAMVIMLLGEATFHQVHGGVATNSTVSRWPEYHDEYIRIRGHEFHTPRVRPRFYGSLNPWMRPSLAKSIAGLG